MSSSAIRAGAAYIELTLRDRVSKPLHAASIALKDFGNAVSWQGAKITAMGAAITAPLAAMGHSFAQTALELGRVGNRRDAVNVFNYVSALLRLSDAFGELRNAVGSAVLPLMTRWPNTLARIVSQAAAWVRQNRQLVQTIARFGAVLVGAGTALVFVGRGLATLGSVFGGLATVTSTIATGIGMLGGMFAALLTPLGLVIAGAVAFGAWMLTSTGIAGEALGWLQEKFAELHDDALKAWQGIGDALATGDIKLAAEILWLTLKMEWQKGVNALNQMWITAKDFFLSTWSNASFTVAGMLIDGWAMAENGWVETVDFLRDTWAIFTNFLQKTWHNSIGFIKKAWVNLKALFNKDIDVNAEVTRINKETTEANAEADAKRDAGILDRDQKRRSQKEDIERRRQDSQKNLGEMQAADNAQRDAEFERQRRASEQALADAIAERDAAAKEAADKKEEQEKKTRYPEPLPILLGEEQKKLDSKGTFNAMAIRGLGSDSLAERTARGVERGADLLKKIDEHARRAAGVFS